MTTLHGSGGLGGKGEGLLILDQLAPSGVERLRTDVLTTELYQRYRDNGGAFDAESLAALQRVHGSFAAAPISVRASERLENDPLAPTSGESLSFMLPNRGDALGEGFAQFRQAVELIYAGYRRRSAAAAENGDGPAVLVNPIPGVVDHSNAGAFYYPLSSGVADSFFRHPLTLDEGPQDPGEGFARVAFGHGYAVVLDDFEVLPVATIRHPLDPRIVTREGQRFFYAIRLDRVQDLAASPMPTMSLLHTRFAAPDLRAPFTGQRGCLNFERLLREDHLHYRTGLDAVMEQLRRRGPDFQIEFTWNIADGRGVFHVVQYKVLRQATLRDVEVPPLDEEGLLATDQFQGHGVIEGLRHAVVINPFAYRPEQHDEVVRACARLNQRFKERGERYVLVCPGRIGTSNRQWGFYLEFSHISNAALIVEYGYDVHGSPNIAVTADEMTGGIYGSHFLYQILGGADQAERARRARLFGSQGTHFLTNLYTSGALYLFVNPVDNFLSRWFFVPPAGQEGAPIYEKAFVRPLRACADLRTRRCVLAPSQAEEVRAPTAPAARPFVRQINPHRLTQAFVLCARDELRVAARGLERALPSCAAQELADLSALFAQLSARTFALFVDEGALAFLDRARFVASNPRGQVVLLSDDLRVGSAPTREELLAVCPLAERADHVFYFDRGDCLPERVLPAAVRYVEDVHNIAHHKEARRFIFLVVDDELRWFSQFLPVLYRIIGQRAGVMTARTLEEAWAVMDAHGSDVVCLITDMLFPRGGVVSADSGRELVIGTKTRWPRIPIIIASKADQGRELQAYALILPKGDPGAEAILEQYVRDFTGLGDFLFYQGATLWRRAATLRQLRDAIVEAPLALLEEYAEKDYFSTWLYMHGFRSLANTLVVRRDRGPALREVLRTAFDRELALVEVEDLVLFDADDRPAGRARSIEDLARLLDEVDAGTLESHAARDAFSTWLMRRGHPRLADEIRPIHGTGDELRSKLRAVVAAWRGISH